MDHLRDRQPQNKFIVIQLKRADQANIIVPRIWVQANWEMSIGRGCDHDSAQGGLMLQYQQPVVHICHAFASASQSRPAAVVVRGRYSAPTYPS